MGGKTLAKHGSSPKPVENKKFSVIQKRFPGKFETFIDFKRAAPFYKNMVQAGLWAQYKEYMSAYCKWTDESMDNSRVHAA